MAGGGAEKKLDQTEDASEADEEKSAVLVTLPTLDSRAIAEAAEEIASRSTGVPKFIPKELVTSDETNVSHYVPEAMLVKLEAASERQHTHHGLSWWSQLFLGAVISGIPTVGYSLYKWSQEGTASLSAENVIPMVVMVAVTTPLMVCWKSKPNGETVPDLIKAIREREAREVA